MVRSKFFNRVAQVSVPGVDEKKFEYLVYRALTKFYQNVLLPKFATKEDLKSMERMVALEENMATSV